MKLINLAAVALLAGLLNSCSSIPPVAVNGTVSATSVEATEITLAASYANLAERGGKVFQLDPKLSTVRIYVFRAGSAARLGHNHVLSAPTFSGFVYVPDGASAAARFDLAFRLDQLEIDKPEFRAALGGAFSSVISPEMIASTREHMLGAENMQAEQYPLVRIHALQITGESPRFAAKVRVEMHGQAREMWLPLRVEGLPDRVTAAGSLVLRQSDFGIKPYSVFGGLMAVQDEVVIEFNLVGGK